MADEDRKEYDRYKLVVKIWERDFRKQNKRIPSRHDIKEAPQNVKQAYKMYYRLKTAFLSHTLTDVLNDNPNTGDDDSSQYFTTPQNSADLLDESTFFGDQSSQVNESVQETTSPVEPLNKTKPPIRKSHEYEAVAHSSTSDVWSSSLRKKKIFQSSEKAELYPKNLARTGNFRLNFDMCVPTKPLRDPRKKLSRSTSLNFTSANQIAENESLPDLESILLSKSKRKLEETVNIIEIPTPNLEIKTNVTEDWLSRTTPSNKMPRINENVTHHVTNLGISNLNTTNVASYINIHSKPETAETKLLSDNPSDNVFIESKDAYEEEEESVPVLKKRKLSPKLSEAADSLKEIKQIPIKPIRKTIQKLPPPVKELPLTHHYETDDDDSDKDPDYKQNDQEKKSPSPVVMTRKRSFIKRSKESITKATKKAARILVRKNKNYKVNNEEEPEPETTQHTEEEAINFFTDTNFERIRSVPRASEKEIHQSEKLFDNFIQQQSTNPSTKKIIDHKTATKKEALQKKVASGTLNENYVRANLKKKVFVRGKKAFNFSRYKKTLWKSKKTAMSALDDMRGCDGGVLKCFNCGGVGHFASQCKKKEDNLMPIEADVEESTLPTLQEAAEMANSQKLLAHANRTDSIPLTSNNIWNEESDDDLTHMVIQNGEEKDKENVVANCSKHNNQIIAPKKTYIGHQIPTDFLEKSGILEMATTKDEQIEPYLSLNSDGSIPHDVPKEVIRALHQFGHKSFRNGQENAIMRILCGMSTLVTLSTGSGKSLCYQLPAYLYRQKYHCITLVISPLVSLMEDQVYGIPDFINAQCLHTNQTPKQREKVMNEIKHGRVEILLVSPEAVVSSEKSTGFGAILKQLPPIAFACIDEAHCVSQWSHNFRPSYLMICRVLRDKLGVNTVLGLTATATLQTRRNIVDHLAIPDGLDGIISDTPLPNNLVLTISKDENRDKALLELLRSDRFKSLQSVIIYCTRRDECERIAGFLRTCLQDSGAQQGHGKKRKRTTWFSEAYHAGMVASRRRTIQNAFMKGELRIVVATIAFGMGINLSNIRGIIHFNMPKSFENYVQEVGRAGRDGKTSHCHVFLSSRGEDLSELRRHIYANAVDRHVIRKLLKKIFIPCSCKNRLKDEKETSMCTDSVEKSDRICPGHEVCFSIEETVQSLDIPEENIATLLCYLELHEDRYIKVLGNAYTKCKIISYSGAGYMKQMAKSCPPLAMAIALELKKRNDNDLSSIEFCVVDVASAIGWDSGVVKYQLKQLEWTNTNGSNRRSPLTVTFSDVGFRIRAPGDLTDDELDRALDLLQMRTEAQERNQLVQLQLIFNSFMSLSFPSITNCSSEESSSQKSDKLKEIIRTYFQTNLLSDVEITDEIDKTTDQDILSSIRQIIQMYPENNFSGRSLGRIFHGISSPCFPAVIWGRCKFWRAHLCVNFLRLVRLGNQEIVRTRLSME